MSLVLRSSERPVWHEAIHPRRWYALGVRHGPLVWQLMHREVTGRYRGSLLGTAWSLLLPCLAVIVYTIVFGLIFKQRWPGIEPSSWTYPLILWAGLALYQTFAEVIQRAPSSILAQPNLVKKVVFPLEVLPVVLVGASLVPLGMALTIVVLGITLVQGTLPHFPLLLLVVCLFLVWLQGIAWLLAGIGTFLRDLAPMVQAACPLVLFLSPVFYPVAVVPAALAPWYWLNPLAVAIETVRAALLHTPLPPLWALVYFAFLSVVSWHVGALVFARLRPEMADVV